MADPISRRRMLFGGLATAVGAVAARLPGEEAEAEYTDHGAVLQNLHIEHHGDGPAIYVGQGRTLIANSSVKTKR